MKERLLRVLNIKHSESSQVFDLLTVQFFIGLANALGNIIALTLFVYSLSIHALPWVYLVIAAVLLFLNFFYEKLEHRFSPITLLKFVIGFSAVLMAVLWLGLAFGNKEDFIFALFVCSVAIYMLTGYAFWGLVSLLFNIRESRRVFSVVGAGDIPAKLIGYLVAPLLIPFIGISNLLWLAVISLCTGLFLFSRFTRKKSWNLLRSKSMESHEHAEHKQNKEDLVQFFFKHKLIFIISLLSIISYNVFVLVDYTFISQVKLRFANITDLALYIAVFFAFGRIIAMAFKFIFTSRVIEKLGVISCLFITPVALFAFSLLFFFNGPQSNYNLFIFGLMAMLTEVLRSTMQEPVFFILFQPLKENLRLKGHMISKGYMYPPSLFIVGLSLVVLHRYQVEMTILLAIKILLLNLVGWAAIIFFMKRIYLDTIHASIRKGIFSGEDIYINDQKTIDILLAKVKNGKRIEVIYALNLLEKANYENLGSLLEDQLESGHDDEVKKYVLERLEELGPVNPLVLKQILPQVTDAEMEQKIVSLLCKHDPGFLKEAAANMNGADYLTRKIVIINLLNQREFSLLFKAGKEINNLLYSKRPVDRELAVEIISELKNVKFSDAIEQLIHDEDAGVKRMAITAACKLHMRPLLPHVMSMLDEPDHKNIVLKGLLLYGDELYEDIQDPSVKILPSHLQELIRIAGKLKGKSSTSFLLSKLNEEHKAYEEKIINALWVKEYVPSGGDESEKFSWLLDSYLKSGLNKMKDYANIPEFSDKDLIKRSIFNEVKSDLQVALKACALLFRKKEINRILELMEIDKQDKLYNAMEMLELVLPKRISTELNLLFDFILDAPQHGRSMSKVGIDGFFQKVVFNEPQMYNPWTKAVCVYSSWRNNDIEFLKKLKAEKKPDENLLVQETKEFVMASIN